LLTVVAVPTLMIFIGIPLNRQDYHSLDGKVGQLHNGVDAKTGPTAQRHDYGALDPARVRRTAQQIRIASLRKQVIGIAPSSPPVIVLENLVKFFGRFAAIRGISASFAGGRLYVILAITARARVPCCASLPG